MHLLAQDPVEIFQVIDRYGVSLGLVLAFLAGTAYVLRRLLGPKDGILTRHFKSDQEHRAHLVQTVRTMSDTGEKISDVMVGMNARLKAIEEQAARTELMHYDEHSRFATIALGHCFLSACDVAESVMTKLDASDLAGGPLGPSTKPLLDTMRTRLREHLAIANHSLPQAPTPAV